MHFMHKVVLRLHFFLFQSYYRCHGILAFLCKLVVSNYNFSSVFMLVSVTKMENLDSLGEEILHKFANNLNFALCCGGDIKSTEILNFFSFVKHLGRRI